MASVPAPLAAHPNASLATGLGGAGVLAVWLAGHLGASLTGEESAALSGAVTSLGLLIGRRGVRGLLHFLWRGSG